MKTLVVCEKPDAASRVAQAIDEEGNPWRQELRGVPFFECGTKDGSVTVCSALGHLYAVDSKGTSSRHCYPTWEFEWKPRHQAERSSARLERWIQVIGSLARRADHFVNACDYDIEGSLIGETILRYACGNAHLHASRMKFSTMTEHEIKSAYKTLSPRLDFSLIEAGRCRHELDWLYGINLSRLLTESVLKARAGYATLSTGRVQGPALHFVVEREEAIGCFVPTPFWTIEATIEHESRTFSVDYYRDRIPTLKEAREVVLQCRNKFLEVESTESQHAQQPPPYPFDLSTLQSEAFRHFGFSPSKTLAIAERLYLDALVSYPRTASQKLPPEIGYKEILRALSNSEYQPLATRLLAQEKLYPRQGTNDDPAHPAIFPTGELSPALPTGAEGKLYDLIVRRFMSTFAAPAVRRVTRAVLEKDTHKFILNGSQVLKLGWAEFYEPYVHLEVIETPELKIGMRVRILRISSAEKFTQPPPRFNSASLLRKMEEVDIGTKATRGEIIEILYKRGYVKEPRMKATPLGTSVTMYLAQYCPLIVDPGFTANLEDMMEKIREGKTTRKLVMLKAIQHVRTVMLDLISKEGELGTHLAADLYKQRVADSSFKIPCPRCGSILRMVRNRKTGKRFIGCSGRWEKNCSFSLPLPQFGRISILDRKCEACGFQMIKAPTVRKHSLVSCPQCYTNKARQTKGAKTAATPDAPERIPSQST